MKIVCINCGKEEELNNETFDFVSSTVRNME